MSAGRNNLTIEQGATFSRTWTWLAGDVPVDLTGYTADAQIRQHPTSGTVVLDLASYLTLGGAAGTILLEIPDETTATFTIPAPAYWDLHLIVGGVITRLLEGKVYLSEGVTR